MAFGEILKQKRLEHGWTREYVAERLNMRTLLIEVLETENLKRIVAPAYGRGYIRNYCRELGIDPQPLEADYLAKISSGAFASHPEPVSHPAVRGIPEKPVEPIHTGAHRTLPPKEEPRATTSNHKFVDSAEASFTAVPKPAVSVREPFPEPPPAEPPAPPPPPPAPAPAKPSVPPPPPPAPPAEEPFRLQGDELPVAMPAPVPAAKPAAPRTSGTAGSRTALADFATRQTPHREIRRELPVADTPSPSGQAIFSPQKPVEDPINPALGCVIDLFKGIGHGIRATINFFTKPKVRRIDGRVNTFFTPRFFGQVLAIFGLLVGLTLLVFAFRYVFRMSAEAETELGISGAAAPNAVFEPTPVADPPTPYFP